MFLKFKIVIAVLFVILVTPSCSTDRENNADPIINAEDVPEEEAQDDEQMEDEEDSANSGVDTNSMAANGCQNVVIYNGHAYAACGGEIEVVNLETLERDLLPLSADDITVDPIAGLLFTQSGSQLQMLNVVDPMQPEVVTTLNTNFGIFSGIAAANGVLAVSGGTTNSDTQVYTYTATSVTLVNDGIPLVDGITGNPDVHMATTPNGALAFYSQDLGRVENWGIQIVEFSTDGTVIATPEVVVLTPRPFTGSFGVPFGPANFPSESEFLDNRVYVAHFADPGVQIIDLEDANTLSLIPLPYEPTNIGTDGEQLFVVGVTSPNVDIIDPETVAIVNTIEARLVQAIGVAASANFIAVADRTQGLVVISR